MTISGFGFLGDAWNSVVNYFSSDEKREIDPKDRGYTVTTMSVEEANELALRNQNKKIERINEANRKRRELEASEKK